MRQWVSAIIAYTFAGTISGALVGSILGFTGKPFEGIGTPEGRVALLVGLASVFILREAGILHFQIPEIRRQTHSRWFLNRGLAWNAAGWGFDVGLTFATWITFSGAWLLASISVTFSDPVFGAGAFAIYWLGRASPHLFEPILLRNPSATSDLMLAMASNYRLMRLIHCAGLVAIAISLLKIWGILEGVS